MNTLYGLPAGAGLRQGSPWVMKVELAMRCLKIDYDLNNRYDASADEGPEEKFHGWSSMVRRLVGRKGS